LKRDWMTDRLVALACSEERPTGAGCKTEAHPRGGSRPTFLMAIRLPGRIYD
jgi:hypothetical protein